MKVVTFAGAHACGKTAVIMKAVQDLKEQGIHAAVMKLDCISSEDDKIYERAGIPTVKYLSGNTCPDHFFVQSIEQAYAWARERGADMLVTESAGLCGRCSPHIRDIPAVCVIDCLSGISAPFKIGALVRGLCRDHKGRSGFPDRAGDLSLQCQKGKPESACLFCKWLKRTGNL